MLDCDPLLAAALVDGSVRLHRADLYDVVLADGTTFYWSSYDRDLTWNGHVYSAMAATITRTKLGVTNKMVLPELEIHIDATAGVAFNGGAELMSQLHNRLFDGAVITLNRLYMLDGTDTSLGAIAKFKGEVGDVLISGQRATVQVIACNQLAQSAPRRLYQINCSNIFCDPNCTLLQAAFTASFTVGASPSRTFIPWTSAPGNPALYQQGTVTITSGGADGEIGAIDNADGTGIYLAYPLNTAPAPGDTFDAFEGCPRTLSICTSRGNSQFFAGFRFIPPATLAI